MHPRSKDTGLSGSFPVSREGTLSMPQRAIVIHSPHSGRSEKLVEAITHLKQTGVEVVNTISIADLDQLPAQGTTWKESGIDVAIAARGDGSALRTYDLFCCCVGDMGKA